MERRLIFLDTNILIRAFIRPSTQDEHDQHSIASGLLGQIAHDEVQATVSEIVIQQTLYFLAGNNWYRQTVDVAVGYIRSILLLPGLRMNADDLAIIRHALVLWEQRPSLGFPDCLIASRCLRYEYDLATFDRNLRKLPDLTIWESAI